VLQNLETISVTKVFRGCPKASKAKIHVTEKNDGLDPL